jgi:glycosyltransferase involved in cell wall biosynthesis
MKIDLIGPSYPFRGGISHYTTLLFQHLKERHDTRFYCFKRQYPRFLFPGESDRDSSLEPLRDTAARPLLDSLNPFSWLRTARAVVKDKPELTIFPWWVVFWAPQFLTIILFLKLFSKTRILFICHNIQEHEGHPLKYMLSKWVLRRGDYFIVHSEEEKERLVRALGQQCKKGRIRVCFHPTYAVFNQGEISRDEAREALGIAEENVLLFFGFVRDYKGLKYLLEAMPEILERLPVRLVIAGEFWEGGDVYRNLIGELDLGDNVTIVDRYIPNEEVPRYFRASDLVVLPYVSVTGSGLVQLAFGFDTPVVVSRIGALEETVRDGETGFLVSPEAPSEIAEAVVRFFNVTDRQAMRKAIRADRARFSWDGLIRTVENFQGEWRLE